MGTISMLARPHSVEAPGKPSQLVD